MYYQFNAYTDRRKRVLQVPSSTPTHWSKFALSTILAQGSKQKSSQRLVYTLRTVKQALLPRKELAQSTPQAPPCMAEKQTGVCQPPLMADCAHTSTAQLEA
jgi:hypothetical protein